MRGVARFERRRVPRIAAAMHIVIVAWLFITFTMSLTMRPIAGVVFFACAGLVPVLLYAALALKRRRAARAAAPAGRPPMQAPGE
jgi:4-hydroxybenzoate polyprenyltransferase